MTATRGRRIDPATGDYTLANGRFVADTTPASKCVLALRTPRGSCPVAPTFGSRLHEIRLITARAGRLAESYAREALEHLKPVLRDLEVTATISGTALLLVISYTAGSGETKAIDYQHQAES